MDKKEIAANWKAFREAGLLWWVNRSLHLFGWSIVLVADEATGEVFSAYPARTKWRGFSEEDERWGYEALGRWMATEGTPLFYEAFHADGEGVTTHTHAAPLCACGNDSWILPADGGWHCEACHASPESEALARLPRVRVAADTR